MEPTSNNLLDLASSVAKNAKIVSDYLQSNSIAQPSFGEDGPKDFPVTSDNEEAQTARQALLEASKTIRDLLLGPRESLYWLSFSFHDFAILRAVYRFKLANAVPLKGEASYSEIAKATGVDEDTTRRIIGHAITNRIFQEHRDGFVSHSAMSTLLVQDQHLIDWVGHNLEEVYPSSAKLVETIQQQVDNGTSLPAFNSAFQTSDSLFTFYEKNPERVKRFGGAMQAMTSNARYSVDHVVKGYPWEKFSNATIVDVGGSFGQVSIAIAQQNPTLKFTIQDLVGTVAEGEARLPENLKSRVAFMVHDFFTPQPVHGADIYFLRQILHDWPDHDCLRILRSLLPALKPGARILINDAVLPPASSSISSHEKFVRNMDMQMMIMLQSRERTSADWESLFKATDPRFKVSVVPKHPLSTLSIIEAIYE